jgi:hypothetical protein
MLVNQSSPQEHLSHISSHTLGLFLLLHKGLGFLSLRAFTYCYLLFAFYFIANYTPKTSKLLHSYYCLLVKSADQYLQLLVGSSTFLLEKYYNWSLALGSHHMSISHHYSSLYNIENLKYVLVVVLYFNRCWILVYASNNGMTMDGFVTFSLVVGVIDLSHEPDASIWSFTPFQIFLSEIYESSPYERQ